jgi:hypothetical protein
MFHSDELNDSVGTCPDPSIIIKKDSVLLKPENPDHILLLRLYNRNTIQIDAGKPVTDYDYAGFHDFTAYINIHESIVVDVYTTETPVTGIIRGYMRFVVTSEMKPTRIEVKPVGNLVGYKKCQSCRRYEICRTPRHCEIHVFETQLCWVNIFEAPDRCVLNPVSNNTGCTISTCACSLTLVTTPKKQNAMPSPFYIN